MAVEALDLWYRSETCSSGSQDRSCLRLISFQRRSRVEVQNVSQGGPSRFEVVLSYGGGSTPKVHPGVAAQLTTMEETTLIENAEEFDAPRRSLHDASAHCPKD